MCVRRIDVRTAVARSVGACVGRTLTIAICLLMILPVPPLAAEGELARLSVDPNARHQKINGFGATIRSLVYGSNDYLSPEERNRVIEVVFKDVGLSMGNLHIPNLEREHNDDGDPQHLNRAGFDLQESRAMKERVVDRAMAFGPQIFYLAASIDLRNMLWLKELRHRNYEKYLEECAEHVLAAVKLWKDELGFTSTYVLPFNEPLTGNRELAGGSAREVIDIIKRAGARLRREGFGQVRFVIAGEETPGASLKLASAILDDPEARPLVGAIAYHAYPYGSAYASVPNILRSSGAGHPVPEEIAIRAKLRDLAREQNLPLWMTEISHSEVGGLSFNAVLGRAIHIHDELVYADAGAYFGMHAMWDSWSHREHFQNRNWDLLAEGDTIVLIDKEASKVHITGMGYAIGHYARWLGQNAYRVEAASSDALVQVTAFKDEPGSRLILVIINNHSTVTPVGISISHGKITGTISGEESTAGALWKPLAATRVVGSSFERLLPPKSLNTLAVNGFELWPAKASPASGP